MVEYQLEYSRNSGTSWVVLQAWAADQSEPLNTTALPDGLLLLRAKARDSIDLLEAAGDPVGITVANRVVSTRSFVVSAATSRTRQTLLPSAVLLAQGRTRTVRMGAVTYVVTTDTEQFYHLSAVVTPAARLTGALTSALRLSGDVT